MSWFSKIFRSTRSFSSLLTILPLLCFAVDSSTPPKRQGICGKSVNAILKLNPKENSASIEKAFVTQEELCDEGRYEMNANFRVILRNSHGIMVYDKQVYLNTKTFLETTKSPTSTAFGVHKIKEDPTYRIVKFPLEESMKDFETYEIESYPDKTAFGKGTMPLVKKDVE